MRRLAYPVTLVVLFGVFVLSAPVMAGGSAQSAKAQASVVVKAEVAKPAVAQHQVSSFRSVIVQTLRFQVARWLGIVVGGSNRPDQPQMSDHDYRHRFDRYIILKDHGGDSVDI
jgi:hypothetical protein